MNVWILRLPLSGMIVTSLGLIPFRIQYSILSDRLPPLPLFFVTIREMVESESVTRGAEEP
jgi:hypothetical protein